MTSHSRDHICLTHHVIPQHQALYMFVVLMNENSRMPVTEESFQGPNHFLIVYKSSVIVLCGGPRDKSQIPGVSQGSRTLSSLHRLSTSTAQRQLFENEFAYLHTSPLPLPEIQKNAIFLTHLFSFS